MTSNKEENVTPNVLEPLEVFNVPLKIAGQAQPHSRSVL